MSWGSAASQRVSSVGKERVPPPRGRLFSSRAPPALPQFPLSGPTKRPRPSQPDSLCSEWALGGLGCFLCYARIMGASVSIPVLSSLVLLMPSLPRPARPRTLRDSTSLSTLHHYRAQLRIPASVSQRAPTPLVFLFG